MSNKSQGDTAPKPLQFSLQEVEYNGEKFNEVRIDIDAKTTVSVGTDVYFERTR